METGEQQQQASGNGAAPAVEGDGWEWAIVEIFGHRRHAGRTREEERFGAKMLRVDIPVVSPDGTIASWQTQYYGGSAIFSYALTDEASVVRANKGWEPPSRVSLPSSEDRWSGDDDEP